MKRLAGLYAKKGGNLKEALVLSEKTLKAYPNDAGYIDTLSDIFYVQGDANNAIKNIRKAIQLEPNNTYYKQQLWKFKNVKPKPIG